MVKKKRNTGRRRKKSNTTTTIEEQQQHRAVAKRPKTVSDANNRLTDAIKAMIDSMDEEHLYSVMEYAGKVGKELIASDTLQPQRQQQRPQQPQQKLLVQKEQLQWQQGEHQFLNPEHH